MSNTGTNYPNRSDLRNAGRVAARAETGQTYGEAGKQMASQRAMPIAQAPTDMQAQQTERPIPGTLGNFLRPTERPNEPITAGADFGSGPNAYQAGIPMMLNPQQSAIEELRAIYQMFPSDDLLDLLNAYAEDFE
jgi:hypothetical protein